LSSPITWTFQIDVGHQAGVARADLDFRAEDAEGADLGALGDPRGGSTMAVV